ncbi:MAG: glycosyltransferase family 4 protein [Bacillota bacterium]|nr:glycosyltransferase family 4 protein [Bacillota bacterium]
MLKILFVTNLPSPYRVDFFNELGKSLKLTVFFERHFASNRDSKWKSEKAKHYIEVYSKAKPIGTDKSCGLDLIREIRKKDYDRLIISNYGSPSVMMAILYCNLFKVEYIMEHDGGFNKKDNFFKGLLKRALLKSAAAHFTTCNEHIKYLLSIGVLQNRIFKYPFTSVHLHDVLAKPITKEEKKQIKRKLGIVEEKIILSVGQFIYRKGFDLLIEAARDMDPSIGVYIVGGVPPKEYINLRDKYMLGNVHFIDFKSKEVLRDWYCATDLFVLPTREDIWGLVINEAIANGQPIVTTNRCIAGLELVHEEVNGFIVPSDDVAALSNAIKYIMNNDELRKNMSLESLCIAKDYTIEAMAQWHINLFDRMQKKDEIRHECRSL